ncbi:hypothetical protein FRC02_006556 [Tulasnella sp. 418]|nr:hypothetical protein FRC02_006556 [Tulasnella sp. 418]
MSPPSPPNDPPLRSFIEAADQQHQAATSKLDTVESKLDIAKRQIRELSAQLRQRQLEAQKYSQILPSAQKAKIAADRRLKELQEAAQQLAIELESERRLQEYCEELKKDDETDEMRLERYLGELLKRDVEGHGDSDCESEWSIVDGGETNTRSKAHSLPSQSVAVPRNTPGINTATTTSGTETESKQLAPQVFLPKEVTATAALPSDITESLEEAIQEKQEEADKRHPSSKDQEESEDEVISHHDSVPQEQEIPIILGDNEKPAVVPTPPGDTPQEPTPIKEEVEEDDSHSEASVSRSSTPVVQQSSVIPPAVSQPPTPPPKEPTPSDTGAPVCEPAEDTKEVKTPETPAKSLHDSTNQGVADVFSPPHTVPIPHTPPPSNESPSKNKSYGYPPDGRPCLSPASEADSRTRVAFALAKASETPSVPQLGIHTSSSQSEVSGGISRTMPSHRHSRSADKVSSSGMDNLPSAYFNKMENISSSPVPHENGNTDPFINGRTAARAMFGYPRNLPHPPSQGSIPRQEYPPAPIDPRMMARNAGLFLPEDGLRPSHPVSPINRRAELHQKIAMWKVGMTTDERVSSPNHPSIRSPSRSSQAGVTPMYCPQPTHSYDATLQFLSGHGKSPMSPELR